MVQKKQKSFKLSSPLKMLSQLLMPQNQKKITDLIQYSSHIPIGQYSPAELSKILPSDKQYNKEIKTESIVEFLSTTKERSQNIIHELKQLKTLTPEIDEAKRIYVSSILSPNDLQKNSVKLSVNNLSLPQETINNLNILLNTFFNDKLEFGSKLGDWIGECLYETGAKGIVVLPKYNNKILMEAVEQSDNYSGIENLSLNNLKDIYSNNISIESILKLNTSSDKLPFIDKDICIEALSELSTTEEFSYIRSQDHEVIVETISSNLGKFISDRSNYIVISDNPSILTNSKSSKKMVQKKLQKNIDEYFLGEPGRNQTIILSDEINDEDDFPSLIEFPTGSIIPICVPGSVSEHLGYFILVDEWGNPLDDNIIYDSHFNLTKKTEQALYGNQRIINSLSVEQKNKTVETVFNLTIKKLINTKLEDIGIVANNNDIKQYNAITNCIFQKLLKKQKIGLIFVPESLMTYYRFDHREDGTGKSMIESVKFILSLRATLIIANTMAEIKEAVDNVTIEVEFDEKDTNIEQSLDMVRKLYTDKQTLQFRYDPNNIARSLTNNSLKLIPKGVPGLPNSLSTTVDSRPRTVPKTSTELLDKFTEMGRPGFGVPPSALNQLNETEFSRSIVTQNLFFANVVRERQTVLKKFNNKLVRNYLKYSKELQKQIKEILNSVANDDKQKDKNLINNDDITVESIINSVQVTLPSPNVSVSKAQYEEIQQYIGMIDTILNTLFTDELVGIDNRELKDLMVSVRALNKSTMLRSFMETIGFQGSFEIPSIEVAIGDSNVLENMVQSLINLKVGLKSIIKMVDIKTEDSSSY